MRETHQACKPCPSLVARHGFLSPETIRVIFLSNRVPLADDMLRTLLAGSVAFDKMKCRSVMNDISRQVHE
jgi:hypothetical protein